MSHTTKTRYVHLEIALPLDLAHILACYKDIVEENTDPCEGIGHLIGYWVNNQHNAPSPPPPRKPKLATSTHSAATGQSSAS